MRMTKNSPFIICLLGPTASGKTNLAIELTKKLPLEIISVDSAMVYRGMDIGTAKPSLTQRAVTPHRLIDICDPAEIYSAGRFLQDALHEIKNILATGRTPLLVGGTMLYFYVLQKGLSELPTANAEIRAKIQEQAKQQGWEVLHNRLEKIDPVAAAKIHAHDTQRIARALEIFELTGKTFSQIIQEKKIATLPYRILNLAITSAQRNVLHERIKQRWQMMLQQGLLAEVEQLFTRGDLHADLPSMRTVGYRQIWNYLAGHNSYEEMSERALVATRQLAKRQLTWLRGWGELTWFDSEEVNLLGEILQKIAISCD